MGSKTEHERQVFLEFAQAAGLGVDAGSVVPRDPPEPDVRCTLNEKTVYFELARLLDRGMQRLRLKLRKGDRVSLSDEDVRLPEREMLRQKLSKTYETFEAPVNLVLYYDNENALAGDIPVFDHPTFGWHAAHVMRPLIDERPGVFARVWVFERHRQTVMWCSQDDRDHRTPSASAG